MISNQQHSICNICCSCVLLSSNSPISASSFSLITFPMEINKAGIFCSYSSSLKKNVQLILANINFLQLMHKWTDSPFLKKKMLIFLMLNIENITNLKLTAKIVTFLMQNFSLTSVLCKQDTSLVYIYETVEC